MSEGFWGTSWITDCPISIQEGSGYSDFDGDVEGLIRVGPIYLFCLH